DRRVPRDLRRERLVRVQRVEVRGGARVHGDLRPHEVGHDHLRSLVAHRDDTHLFTTVTVVARAISSPASSWKSVCRSVNSSTPERPCLVHVLPCRFWTAKVSPTSRGRK